MARPRDISRLGTVQWYSVAKGYGFLRAEDDPDGPEIFVHYSAFLDDEHEVRDGDRVRFELEEGPKGLRAVRVRRIERNPDRLRVS